MLRYAQSRRAMGLTVEVCLLHVEEVLGYWELLPMFYAGETNTRKRIEPILNRASSELSQSGIPNAAYLRKGEVVFAILDAAEELNCGGIVVAQPTCSWHRLFSVSTPTQLKHQQRNIPLITVNAHGAPIDPKRRSASADFPATSSKTEMESS